MIALAAILSLTGFVVAFPTDQKDSLRETLPISASSSNSLFKEMSVRIFRGTPAYLGQFPWQALLYVDQSSLCGGSLISPTYILTAGHCTSGARVISAYLGMISQDNLANGVTTDSSNVITHPSYGTDGEFSHDIGLIQLSISIATNQNIKIIRLGSNAVGNDVSVTVSGFGQTSDTSLPSRILLYTSLTTMSNKKCEQFYGDDINSKVLCVFGENKQDACPGDSGSAVITGSGSNAEQIGLVSFGSATCVRGYPAALTRISSFREWIKSITGV